MQRHANRYVKGSEQRVLRPLFFRASRLDDLENQSGNSEDEKNVLLRARIERFFGPPLCAIYLHPEPNYFQQNEKFIAETSLGSR